MIWNSAASNAASGTHVNLEAGETKLTVTHKRLATTGEVIQTHPESKADFRGLKSRWGNVGLAYFTIFPSLFVMFFDWMGFAITSLNERHFTSSVELDV